MDGFELLICGLRSKRSTNCTINPMLSPFIRLIFFYYSIDWKYTRRYVVWVGIVILLWTLNVVSTLQCRNNNCHNVTENFTENKTSADRQAGWPNVGMKRSQIFQIFPIAATADFKLKRGVFQNGPKSQEIFGQLLNENVLPRTFKNRPIRSHCWQAWVIPHAFNNRGFDVIKCFIK